MGASTATRYHGQKIETVVAVRKPHVLLNFNKESINQTCSSVRIGYRTPRFRPTWGGYATHAADDVTWSTGMRPLKRPLAHRRRDARRRTSESNNHLCYGWRRTAWACSELPL